MKLQIVVAASVRRDGAVSSRDESKDDGDEEENAENGETDELLSRVAREEG